MTHTRWELKTDLALAVGTGLFALVVYLVTLTPTVPFWDSGEFIATSYVLGIPHPPGTPLYVLLGRVMTLVPFGSIAQRVNGLSALTAAVAVALTYLVAARILAGFGPPFGRSGDDRPPRPAPLGRFGAAIAALTMAFSETYWFNAIEAEVYALAAMVMVGTVYLMLKWRDERLSGGERARHATNIVVLVFYMLALSIAFHMGTIIVFLPLLLFFLSDHYRSLSDARFIVSGGLIVALFFFLGLNWVSLVAILLLSGVLLVVNLDVVGWKPFAALALAGLLMVIGGYLMGEIGPVVGLLLAGALAIVIFWFGANTLVHRNLGFWVAVVFLLGLSVHVFLLVRAAQDPSINEADPSNVHNLWLVLKRDQYKPPPPWEFRGDFETRFVTHFWRYWRPQYRWFWGDPPAAWGARLLMVPFLLGIGGAVMHAARSRRTFLLMAFVIFVTSVGLIWHLNFRADEVRDRDYFFVSLFHFFCVWIGAGAASLVHVVREGISSTAGRRVATALTGAALLFLPIGQLKAGWFMHDRSRFYVARDYAYNLLEPLGKDAIIFTNGDNDTFPLWYIQEVEGIRKDVRVANLSLLNTDWYIKQLRDVEPRVPVVWSDEEIDALVPYYDPRDKRVVQIKDRAVWQIVRANDWKRPVYIAVTVPDLMGYEDRLVMEGLAWRLEREPVAADVDEGKLRNNLDHVYLWRGLLDENGRLDTTIYRDENAMKLAQNYAAARISLSRVYERRGRELFRQGKVDEGEAQYALAIEQLEAAEELRDEFSLTAVPLGILYQAVGRCEDAVRHFGKLIVELESGAGDVRYLPEIYYQRGEARLCAKDYGGAIEDYQEVISLVPTLWEGYEGAARATLALGERSRAVEYVDTWLTSYAGRAEESLVRDARAFREALIGSGGDSVSPSADGARGSEPHAP